MADFLFVIERVIFRLLRSDRFLSGTSCSVIISCTQKATSWLHLQLYGKMWDIVHRGDTRTPMGHPLPQQPSPSSSSRKRHTGPAQPAHREAEAQCAAAFSLIRTALQYTVTSPLYRNQAQCCISPHAPPYEELKQTLLHYPENKSIAQSTSYLWYFQDKDRAGPEKVRKSCQKNEDAGVEKVRGSTQ